MFYGILDLPWWGYIVATLILTHITIVTVTVFLHRHQAHRALELHPMVSHFFRLWLWLTTGMETKAWAAIHRKHHAKCETKDDPHSPQILGLGKVLWEGAELYRKEAKNKETLERYGHGTPNDWLENNVYCRSQIGIYLMLTIDVLLFGVPGVTVWAIQMAWIPFFAAGFINGVGHFWGYRNFECPDAATNIVPWGILIGGEELHNNHHTFPTSAKLSVKWWEFDLGWLYIKLMSYMGLAKVKRSLPKAQSMPGKSQIDGETVKAIISTRFQLMASYTKMVVLPVFRQESQKVANLLDRPLMRKIKALLVRSEALIDEQTRQKLEGYLTKNHALEVVYQFRKRLQAIWGRTTANQKELREAIQDWCRQAEQTKIKVLEDFAAYLRGYMLVNASIA